MNTETLTQQKMEELVKTLLLKEKFSDYKISLCGSSEKGDGYLGDIQFVEVYDKEKSGKPVYNLVIKCAKDGEEFRKMMHVNDIFKNEIAFYTEIIPEFLKFQQEKGIKNGFNNVAKCLGHQTLERKEALILENMKTKGFELHNRRFPMNDKHIKKVLETYAKLHALSFALKDQKPEVFQKLRAGLIDLIKLFTEQDNFFFTDKLFDTVIDLARKENEHEIVEKCSQLSKVVVEIYKKIALIDEPYSVILHGDCWNNNFLFKYEDEAKTSPSDVCLLDFQVGRIFSPVCDLACFLFCTLCEKTAKDFDNFNNHYYECLSRSIKELGSDPDKLYPFEVFMEHWKKYAILGVVLAPLAPKVCLAEPDEVPDFSEVAKSGKKFGEMFSGEVNRVDEYRDRTFPIIKLAISKGFC